MVKRSIDQKLRSRNFDARNDRIEIGALVTNRWGQRGVERESGECYQWKGKRRHDEDKLSVQNRHRVHPLNHRHKGMVEIYREERVSEVGVHLGSLLDNRAEIS